MKNCPICGGKMIDVKNGELTFYGELVKGLDFSKCENCGEIFFNWKQCEQYEKKIDKLR